MNEPVDIERRLDELIMGTDNHELHHTYIEYKKIVSEFIRISNETTEVITKKIEMLEKAFEPSKS